MKHDKDLLKIDKLPSFRAFLEAIGLEVRDGKGSFEVLQVKTFPNAINWAVINKNAAGILSTHPDLRPLIQSFKAGREAPKTVAAAAAPAPGQFLEDLRDDMAMAALQGLLSNPNVLGKHPDDGRALGPNTPAMAAREAYRVADAMLEARKARSAQAPARAPRKSDEWSSDWKANGFNGCMIQASKALRYLASNDRPNGGESSFNFEHLIQLADELELTKTELLAP